VQVSRDHALGLGLHPRRHERRQVALRDAVEHELLEDEAHRIDCRHPVLGQPLIGCRLEQEAVAELPGEVLELLDEPGLLATVRGSRRGLAALVDRHVRTSSGCAMTLRPPRSAGIPHTG
jgi:hypothetical protein